MWGASISEGRVIGFVRKYRRKNIRNDLYWRGVFELLDEIFINFFK